MSMFVDSHADQDASVSLTRGLGLASERLAPPVEPRSIESMSPEQLRDRIAWLEAEVAALRMVCPSEHRPDPREALLPAEKAMGPGERVEYAGAPARLRARFHALAREHAESSAAATSLAFERDHWMDVALRRADEADKSKAATVDALARGEDEGYRRAVEDMLRVLIHPSDKAAARRLLVERGLSLVGEAGRAVARPEVGDGK